MPLAIHGHFYQPPRENPWTDELEPQPDAAPFRDWNERVYAECYRPNAFVRVATARGERIVSNFERLSFNVGPTLMRWMERHHPETHMRIVESDGRSLDRLGHGNALAQAFHHSILPLAPLRDVRTEIRWGLADFRRRFGREPEGMWLPETAANDAVLGALIDEEVRFTILAPNQAGALKAPDGEWLDLDGRPFDSRIPYRFMHPDGSGRSIGVFFYDGEIAKSIAFENLGASAERFLDLFEAAGAGDDVLVHAATDGETYGHHHTFSDLGLAYALFVEADKRDLEVTNYATFLEDHPPTTEVRLAPGGTSWSCFHGVERWRSDCGCSTGAEPGWNQAWRAPLRHALELVKAEADRIYSEAGAEVMDDPWSARDAYVEVVIGARSIEDLLDEHLHSPARPGARGRAADLLEMQRSALAMFTSCGWFFADVGGVETVQVLRYALRTIDLLEGAGGEGARDRFAAALEEARSNRLEVGSGRDVVDRIRAAGFRG